MSATDVLLGQSRGLRIALGVVTMVAGALILTWPGGTLLAVAVLLGIQLIVVGIVRAVTAFTFDADSVAGRILFLLLGVLLVIVGILCLRAPLQTIAILVLLFGLSTIVSGVLEFFHGVTGGGGWAITSGIVSILIGIIVLSYPVGSVSTMIWLFGLSLLVVGLTGLVCALTPGRSRVGSHTTAPPAATATP
jgi:uncharacterized membrane protein HdeD (DUF308 family)